MNDFFASIVASWAEIGPAAQGGLSAAAGWTVGRGVGWLLLPRTEREALTHPSRAWVAVAGLLWASSWLLWPVTAAWRAIQPAPPAPPPSPAPLSADAVALVEELTGGEAVIDGHGHSRRLLVSAVAVDVGTGPVWHIWDGKSDVTCDYTKEEGEAIHNAAVARAAKIDADACAARRAARVKTVGLWQTVHAEPKGTPSSPNPRKAGV